MQKIEAARGSAQDQPAPLEFSDCHHYHVQLQFLLNARKNVCHCFTYPKKRRKDKRRSARLKSAFSSDYTRFDVDSQEHVYRNFHVLQFHVHAFSFLFNNNDFILHENDVEYA